MRGGCTAALWASDGAKAVVEGAVLQARPAGGQETSAIAAVASGLGSTAVLRRCELCTPAPGAAPSPAGVHESLVVEAGARGTAADCTCSGRILVVGQGSALLHSGLAFPPYLAEPIGLWQDGVARELPAAAGGSRAGATFPLAAPP